MSAIALTHDRAGAPAGFQARVGKIRRKAPKKKSFAHPGFQFAHPAIRNGCPPCPRTEADLWEKASLATNQEGPSPPLCLTLRYS